jgi:ASCH domain-containing protein
MLSGLLIRSPYIDWILAGTKTWEIRGSSTAKRGRIALIQSGSGTVIGVADLVEAVGPLTRRDLAANARKLGLRKPGPSGPLHYRRTFAWVLKNARRLKTPVRYRHPSGCIIWVNLGPGVQAAISRQLKTRSN